MSFKGKKSEGGGSFEQPPPGLTAAVLTRIVDWGTQEWGNFGPKRRVQFVFEVAHAVSSGEHAGKHMTCSKMYTLSFNSKSNLMADLESWRGKAYGPNDEIDLDAVLGRPCMLTLVEEQRGEYTNVNIKSIASMPQGMAPIAPDEEPFAFNLDAPNWDNFNKLHERTQEKIAATQEYKRSTGYKAQSSSMKENPSGSRSYSPDPVTDGHARDRQPGEDDDFDTDDIPF